MSTWSGLQGACMSSSSCEARVRAGCSRAAEATARGCVDFLAFVTRALVATARVSFAAKTARGQSARERGGERGEGVQEGERVQQGEGLQRGGEGAGRGAENGRTSPGERVGEASARPRPFMGHRYFDTLRQVAIAVARLACNARDAERARLHAAREDERVVRERVALAADAVA
eukprot:6208775-Pleurochrysis_carterae.AAC.1